MRRPPRHPHSPPPPPPPPAGRGHARGWDEVAAWYDKLVGEGGSDYHRALILPGTLRLLDLQPGERVLDLCCGQGVLVPHLLAAGPASVAAVDASPRLIAAARTRHGGDPRVRFVVADASRPGAWADATHDAAACLMAAHDVADAAGLFRNLGAALRPGGRAVVVLMHPCFRIPRQSHWGWDADHKIQFRRLDCYGTPLDIPIQTHPGQRSGEQTWFHHRPLAWYLEALGKAGLGVTGAEEWCSHRRSQPGPRSRAEHRAAREFPLFLALRAVRVA